MTSQTPVKSSLPSTPLSSSAVFDLSKEPSVIHAVRTVYEVLLNELMKLEMYVPSKRRQLGESTCRLPDFGAEFQLQRSDRKKQAQFKKIKESGESLCNADRERQGTFKHPEHNFYRATKG